MKIRIILFTVMMLLGGLTKFGFSQPPPPGYGHGSGNNESPAGAPIGSGTLILITLSMTYAGTKVYIKRTTDKTE